MSNALSLRRVPLMTIRAHPIRSLIIAVLALAQAACVFGGFILVGAMRAELSLAERRLGADLVVYPTSCLNQVEKKRLLMLGTPVGCHQPRSALARMSSNEDIAAVSYQLYVSETLSDGSTRWVVGFQPESDFVLGPWMREGEGTSLPRGSVVVGAAVPVRFLSVVPCPARTGRPSPSLGTSARLARTSLPPVRSSTTPSSFPWTP